MNQDRWNFISTRFKLPLCNPWLRGCVRHDTHYRVATLGDLGVAGLLSVYVAQVPVSLWGVEDFDVGAVASLLNRAVAKWVLHHRVAKLA